MAGISGKSSTITHMKDCTGCGCRFQDSMKSMFGTFPVPVKAWKVNKGVCPECKTKINLQKEKMYSARDLNWTHETVRKYFIKNPPFIGQELIVLDTSGRLNTYALVTVKNPEHTNQKRIVIESYTNGYSGQVFHRSGKNCFAPTGQVTLLPYNQIIGEIIKKGNGREVILSLEEVAGLIGKVDSLGEK